MTNNNLLYMEQEEILDEYYRRILFIDNDMYSSSNIEEDRNLIGYVNRLGMDYGGDINHYISEYGSHWSTEGHIEVARLIENFIKKEHDN